MRVYGKIVDIISSERIIRVKETNRLVYLYMSRKLYKDFNQYFSLYPYVILYAVDTKRRIEDYVVYDIDHFEKIVKARKDVFRFGVFFARILSINSSCGRNCSIWFGC